MATTNLTPPSLDAIELGNLLATTIESVVSAQSKLDDYTLQRAREFEATEPGTLAIPPLWFTFQDVMVELEMSASVSRVAGADGGRSQLVCRTLEPTAVGLFGYQASSGLRVRVRVAPQGTAVIRPPRESTPP
jgi:hypothetical protein